MKQLSHYMVRRRGETDQQWEKLTLTIPEAVEELMELIDRVRDEHPRTETDQRNKRECLRLHITEILLRLHRKELDG